MTAQKKAAPQQPAIVDTSKPVQMVIGGGATGQNGALGDGPNKGIMEMGGAGGPQSAIQNGKLILGFKNLICSY